MDSVDPKQTSRIAAGTVVFLILAFTVGVFLAFRPEQPKGTYWITFVDFVLMELAMGILALVGFFRFSAAAGKRGSQAMSISIGSFAGLVFSISFIGDLLFLFVLNSEGWQKTFLWLVVGKWVVLVSISLVLWIVGRDDRL